jgi:hypothetical protein
MTLGEAADDLRTPVATLRVETMLRRHVYPSLGDKRLSAVLPSDVQALVKRLSLDLAPSTVGVVHRILAGIFKAAVLTGASSPRRARAPSCPGSTGSASCR